MAKHKNGEIKIEKGVPLVPVSTCGAEKYPFKEMEVGDSFFLSGRLGSDVRGAVYNRARYLGMRAMVRTVEGGVRVWRIA